jgi:cell division septum initiation protein DivIVA
VSRWSEEFENHPIHQQLDQISEFLETEVEDTDAAFEDERRRLKNVISNLREIIDGLDPEFFPKQWIDQVQGHLAHQNFMQQLQAYASNGSINHIQTANNHITQYAPQIFNLASMSRPLESKKLIAGAQEAFASFTASMENTANEIEHRIKQSHAELQGILDRTEAAERNINTLDKEISEKLAEWQEDFTAKQTARAKEHSDAQINRDAKFDELLSAWKATVEEQRANLEQTQTDKLQATLDHFKESGQSILADMAKKHEEVKEIHKLVGRDSVAGGYQSSAGEEKNEANRWRWISLACLATAVIWLGIKYSVGFTTTAEGSFDWPEIVTASSLTAILLIAAGYTSKQSKLHRDNEKLLRSYALETKALDPFIASLDKPEQQAIKAELVRRMFGQQNNVDASRSTRLDDGTVNTLTSRLTDAVKDALQKVGGNS